MSTSVIVVLGIVVAAVIAYFVFKKKSVAAVASTPEFASVVTDPIKIIPVEPKVGPGEKLP